MLENCQKFQMGIYILGMQVIKYRDREYKEKLSKISFRELTSGEISEVMYETDEHKIFKIKVDQKNK